MNWNGACRLLPASTLLAALFLVGCGQRQPAGKTTFYDRNIGPILTGSCSTSPTKSSCHVRADSHGNALGNLDTSSYNTLALRRDLFINHGPYGLPELLLKVVKPYQLSLSSYDGKTQQITTDVAHSGRALLDLTSGSFTTLSRWIQRGAQANNAQLIHPKLAFSACTTKVGSDKLFDPTKDPSTKDYGQFVASVNNVLGTRCANGNCHGSPSNSLYLTCGTSPEQKRWNYFAASDYVSKDVSASDILQTRSGSRTGRRVSRRRDHLHRAHGPRLQGARQVGQRARRPAARADGRGVRLFREARAADARQARLHAARVSLAGDGARVPPARRQRWALRSGDDAPQLRADARADRTRLARSRMPAASSRRTCLLPRAVWSIAAAPCSASGGDPSQCDLNAAATGDLDQQPEYCVLVAWIEKERADRMASAAPLSGIVYVKRPPASGPDTPQDYSTYQPGADLMRAPASLDAHGAVQVGGAGTSLLSMCGLNAVDCGCAAPRGELGRQEDRVRRALLGERGAEDLRDRRDELRARSARQRGAEGRPPASPCRPTAKSSTTSIPPSRRTVAWCSRPRAGTS